MVRIATEITDIPATTSERPGYVCDICGEKYLFQSAAESCEEQHSCDHKDIVYKVTEVGEWSGQYGGMVAYCHNCKQQFGEFEFEEIQEDLELLKKIWELIATHQGITLPITPSDSKT